MRVTAQQVQLSVGCSASLAEIMVEPLNLTFERFQIDTPKRVAAFLAQVGHESGGFKYMREIWGPTPAQSRYEGRVDLGNTFPGDGKRYMGRGLIQITGRHNYLKVSEALGVDFITSPEALESPLYACLSAGWYWNSRHLNDYADEMDCLTVTKKINGGTNGLVDRNKRYDKSCRVFGV